MNLKRLVLVVLAAVAVAVALALIIVPGMSGSSTAHAPVRPDLSVLKFRALVPGAEAFPEQTELMPSHLVSTRQAARINGTDLGLLKRTGREVGYVQEYQTPKGDDFEVEIVRFRDRSGLKQA